MNNFNPYQNNILPQWAVNPQQQAFNNPYQQMQTPTSPAMPTLPGRVINDISEVTAQEVPMDGRISIFPKSDYSCMYAKVWLANGTIATYKFVPEETAPVEPVIDIPQLINDRFDKLESIIGQRYSNNHQNKKGGNPNE